MSASTPTPPLSAQQLLNQTCKALEGSQAMSGDAIAAQLAATPDWALADGFIVRNYSFGNYYQTLAFVNAIAFFIHAEDHHPDLLVSYNRCTVKFNTHSVNGISLNDFICAAKCDALYGARAASA